MFIQVTTFSEVMAKPDVEKLYHSLNQQNSTIDSCELKCVFLLDFNKEKLFSDCLR